MLRVRNSQRSQYYLVVPRGPGLCSPRCRRPCSSRTTGTQASAAAHSPQAHLDRLRRPDRHLDHQTGPCPKPCTTSSSRPPPTRPAPVTPSDRTSRSAWCTRPRPRRLRPSSTASLPVPVPFTAGSHPTCRNGARGRSCQSTPGRTGTPRRPPTSSAIPAGWPSRSTPTALSQLGLDSAWPRWPTCPSLVLERHPAGSGTDRAGLPDPERRRPRGLAQVTGRAGPGPEVEPGRRKLFGRARFGTRAVQVKKVDRQGDDAGLALGSARVALTSSSEVYR